MPFIRTASTKTASSWTSASTAAASRMSNPQLSLRQGAYFFSAREGTAGLALNSDDRNWTKPITLLINNRSFSDAEIFPHAFRKLGLGKLVGQATGGLVIGTRKISLIDGSTFRTPRIGVITAKGVNMEPKACFPTLSWTCIPTSCAGTTFNSIAGRGLTSGRGPLAEELAAAGEYFGWAQSRRRSRFCTVSSAGPAGDALTPGIIRPWVASAPRIAKKVRVFMLASLARSKRTFIASKEPDAVSGLFWKVDPATLAKARCRRGQPLLLKYYNDLPDRKPGDSLRQAAHRIRRGLNRFKRSVDERYNQASLERLLVCPNSEAAPGRRARSGPERLHAGQRPARVAPAR